MKKRIYFKIIYLFTFLFIFNSCENSKYSPFDVNLNSPLIANLQISNYIINTDTIRINNQFSINDTIPITNLIKVLVTDQDGLDDIKSVSFQVIYQVENKIVQKGLLIYNKAIVENGIQYAEYVGNCNFKIQRKLVGFFSIKVEAIDKSENASNAIISTFELIRAGKPPLISDLTAPDSVTLPSIGEKVILMTIKATDPDNDIIEVFFKSLDSSDPNRKFFLYDDGNLTAHGDSIQNDGIYSILISLPYNMTPRSYRFEFQAKDYTELFSNKILHTLKVVK